MTPELYDKLLNILRWVVVMHPVDGDRGADAEQLIRELEQLTPEEVGL